MRESRFTGVIAATLGQPISHVRQILRALREDGQIPGIRGGDLQIEHLAAVITAVTADFVKDASGRARSLGALTLQSAADLPSTGGAMLTRLMSTIATSAVVADYDLDDGYLHIGDDSIVLECLTLSGRRACIRYGSGAPAIAATTTTFPTSALLALATAIGSPK